MRFERCAVCNKPISYTPFENKEYQRDPEKPLYPHEAYLAANTPTGRIEERKVVCSPLCEKRFRAEFERRHNLQHAKRVEQVVDTERKELKCGICGNMATKLTVENLIARGRSGEIVTSEQVICCSPECQARARMNFETKHGIRVKANN